MTPLIDYVSNKFGIASWRLFKNTRKREVCNARQVCMFMLKEYGEGKPSLIADYFGKDRVTVLHAVRVTTGHYQKEKDYRNLIDDVIDAWYQGRINMPVGLVSCPQDEEIPDEQYLLSLMDLQSTEGK